MQINKLWLLAKTDAKAGNMTYISLLVNVLFLQNQSLINRDTFESIVTHPKIAPVANPTVKMR